uniref:Uncharacterized protein n=1 Tax=Mimivirus LCMiAC01 TaxID=2506608 RepID=A0A481Z1M8_9VIRU|nr:MAG: hypothetical protein LCMiAC01_03520 [Mimivirus LCMiAC01]
MSEQYYMEKYRSYKRKYLALKKEMGDQLGGGKYKQRGGIMYFDMKNLDDTANIDTIRKKVQEIIKQINYIQKDLESQIGQIHRNINKISTLSRNVENLKK